MKIDGNLNIGKLSQPGQRDSVSAPGGRTDDATDSAGETSVVSRLAHRIAEAKRIADALPDVRTDKVVLARRRLASGYYDSPQVREALVERLAALVRDTSV